MLISAGGRLSTLWRRSPNPIAVVQPSYLGSPRASCLQQQRATSTVGQSEDVGVGALTASCEGKRHAPLPALVPCA